MSTTCIYQETIVRISRQDANQPEEQYLMLSLVGSNNTYCWDSRRRARNWSAHFLGSREAHIANAISAASGFEGGMTVWKCFGRSGYISPHEYIAKVRRMLDRAPLYQVGQPITVADVPLTLKSKDGFELPDAIRMGCVKAAKAHEEDTPFYAYTLFSVQGDAYA